MYKSLLVPIDGRPRSERSLGLACAMAHDLDAHVTGLFVKPRVYVPSAARAAGAGEMLEQLQRDLAQKLAADAEALFQRCVTAAKLSRTSWHTAAGEVAEVVAEYSRFADLVIANQTDCEAPDATNFADSVLLSLGRPLVLLQHAAPFNREWLNVLVAWDGGREAARAVTDAMPILQRAAKVTVLTVFRGAFATEAATSTNIARYLEQHAVKVAVAHEAAGDQDIGRLILHRAEDMGADLIVLGAYGHSRVREIVLGGVTRTVLREMQRPVLLSH